MANPRATFLANHPRFAAMKSGSPERKAFLAANPTIAARWNEVNGGSQTDAGLGPAPEYHPGPIGAAAIPPPAAAATPAATPPAPTPIGETAAGRSAKAIITSTLEQYGLGPLGEWAWNQYLNGDPQEKIFVDLRSRPEYAARFPGMAELSKKGLAVDEGTYIQAERSYAAQMRAAGLPQGFYDDPTDFGKLIAGNVSATEFGDRLQMAQQTAMASPQGQQLRDELSRLYGIPNAIGMVTAYWIDPDKSATLIKQQFTAGQLAQESAATGFGSLTKDQAEKIGGQGVTADQAHSAFQQLSALGQLRTGLIGDAGSQGIDQNQMIDAAFVGDATQQQRLKTEQRRRTATFEGGGGYAASQKGLTGLGAAQ